jgi:hypothetical protein
MSNYLKKILFTLLILGVPYMNTASKAMNTDDYEGSGVRARSVSFVTADQQDVQSFTKHSTNSTNSQVIGLEDSKVSWASYLSYPIKSIAYKAYEITDFAIKNPTLATVVSLSYAIPYVEAACRCVCCKDCVAGAPVDICRNFSPSQCFPNPICVNNGNQNSPDLCTFTCSAIGGYRTACCWPIID